MGAVLSFAAKNEGDAEVNALAPNACAPGVLVPDLGDVPLDRRRLAGAPLAFFPPPESP
jgi:hypothetical protein